MNKKESNIDRLIRQIDKDRKELMDNVKVSEDMIGKSMNEIILSNTKMISGAFDREIEKLKKAEEETEGELQQAHQRVKDDTLRGKNQADFLQSQITKNKKMNDMFKFNMDSTLFQNSQNINSLKKFKSMRENEHSKKMEELKGKLSVLEAAVEKYEIFTKLSIIKVSEDDLVKLVFSGVSKRDQDQEAYVCLKHYNDTLIGKIVLFSVCDMNPRPKDFFEISQVLTVLKDLKRFVQMTRRSFIDYYDHGMSVPSQEDF